MAERQNITLRVGTQDYRLNVVAEDEEVYRLSRQLLSDELQNVRNLHIDGFREKDYIVIAAINVLVETLKKVGDRSFSSEEENKIKELIEKIENVL